MFVFIIPQTRQNCKSPSALKTYTYSGNIYKQKRCHPLRQHRLACKHYFSIIIIAHRKSVGNQYLTNKMKMNTRFGKDFK